MILSLIIALSEIQKLSLLYFAYTYNSRSSLALILWWLIWQAFSVIVFGKLSDIKGRKVSLFITIVASILVSLLVRFESSFHFALLVDGLLVSTLPIAYAAKNDQHPTKSKRLVYAEACLARALPWCVIPLAYLATGLPGSFWGSAILISSLLSLVAWMFLKDNQDAYCHPSQAKTEYSPSIFIPFVGIILLALFFSESAYQVVAYLIEERENILPLTTSYILFGLGMSFTSAGHLLFKEINGKNLLKICEFSFLGMFFYFIYKFFGCSGVDQCFLNGIEKLLLGLASGVYIPVIYAIVCERFKIHQQGELCGLLESTMTLAEIISPGLVFLLLKFQLAANDLILIIGFGFFISYTILQLRRLIHRES